MKKLGLILFACIILCSGSLFAQNYDTVSGATQKVDGKAMNLDQFKKAVGIKTKKLVFSTVNADGSPNVALYGSFVNIESNVFAVNSMADSKTTKINIIRTNQALLLLCLDEKTEDGFYGAKVVLKYVSDSEKIKGYCSKLKKSSEKTTFFTVEKFLIYR